jgi:hypothetical protein
MRAERGESTRPWRPLAPSGATIASLCSAQTSGDACERFWGIKNEVQNVVALVVGVVRPGPVSKETGTTGMESASSDWGWIADVVWMILAIAAVWLFVGVLWW